MNTNIDKEVINANEQNINKSSTVQMQSDSKKCFLCRNQKSKTNENNCETTDENNFDLYLRLYKLLDFDHGLPSAGLIRKEFNFCCKICSKDLFLLWDFHQQIQSIRSQMKEVVAKIILAFKSKSTDELDNLDNLKIQAENLTNTLGNAVRCTKRKTCDSSDISEELPSKKTDLDSTAVSKEVLEKETEQEIQNEDDFICQEDINDSTDLSDTEINSEPPKPESSLKSVLINTLTKSATEDQEDERAEKTNQIEISSRSLDSPEAYKDTPLNPSSTSGSEPIKKLDSTATEEENSNSSQVPSESRPNKDKEFRFKCKFCSLIFKSFDTIYHHQQRVHHNVRSHICPTCTYGFDTPLQLRTHLSKHTPDKPFHCKNCGQSFPLEEELNIHQSHKCKSLNPSKPNVYCEICKLDLLSFAKFAAHMKEIHNDSKPCKCDQCPSSHPTPSKLLEHKKIVHEKVLPYVCKHDQCGMGFYTKSKLERHAKNHSENKEFLCNRCGKGFADKKGLSIHEKYTKTCAKDRELWLKKKAKAKLRPYVKKKVNPKPCPICGQIFQYERYLTTHIRRVHDKTRGRKCDKCDKAFFSLHELKRHFRRVHDPNYEPDHGEFPCDLCAVVFKSKHNLKNHTKRVHEKWRPHKCEVEECGYSAFERTELLRHTERIHTNPKNKHSNEDDEDYEEEEDEYSSDNSDSD